MPEWRTEKEVKRVGTYTHGWAGEWGVEAIKLARGWGERSAQRMSFYGRMSADQYNFVPEVRTCYGHPMATTSY